MDNGLDVTVRRRHSGVAMVHPRGYLSLRTATELRRILAKELLDHGRVVVDLDGFTVGSQQSWVMIFPAVLAECGGWPAAKMVLCRPDEQMTSALAACGVPTFVPVYHLLLEAQAAVDQRPDVVRMRTGLPRNLWAPATARQLIRDIYPLWQVDDELQHTAQVVVNELVDVTVGDAGAAAALTLERGPGGLRLAVQDAPLLRAPYLPQSRLTDPLHRGRGLGREMLGNLTTAWGVDVASGGKIAWAVIADEARST
jgi:GNAT superfamily N-acetyltransferase